MDQGGSWIGVQYVIPEILYIYLSVNLYCIKYVFENRIASLYLWFQDINAVSNLNFPLGFKTIMLT